MIQILLSKLVLFFFSTIQNGYFQSISCSYCNKCNANPYKCNVNPYMCSVNPYKCDANPFKCNVNPSQFTCIVMKMLTNIAGLYSLQLSECKRVQLVKSGYHCCCWPCKLWSLQFYFAFKITCPPEEDHQPDRITAFKTVS